MTYCANPTCEEPFHATECEETYCSYECMEAVAMQAEAEDHSCDNCRGVNPVNCLAFIGLYYRTTQGE